MITYNHEKYIEQAVRSVMMQKTDFKYELVVGEDCSTDGTREILLRLKEEFQDQIQLILHHNNRGMNANLASVVKECKGDFIALLEGDDYWIDPKKLQLQSECMITNPDCVVCNHNVVVIDESVESPVIHNREISGLEKQDIRGLFNGAHTHTSSVMLRGGCTLPPWFGELQASGDWAILIWALLPGGTIISIPGTPMSVYRRNQGGVTFDLGMARRQQMLSDALLFINHIRPYVNLRLRRYVISPLLYERHLGLYNLYMKESENNPAQRHAQQMMYYALLLNRKLLVKAIKAYLRTFSVIMWSRDRVRRVLGRQS